MGIYRSINMDAVGGTGSANVPYSSSFIVGSWNLDGSFYNLPILRATHGKGAQLNVQVFEKVGVDYLEVVVDVLIDAAGNITLSVPSSPDLRFEGKITIIGE